MHRHRYYDPDVEKVVPKNSIVLDPSEIELVSWAPGWLRAQASSLRRTSVGPIIRILDHLADEIEAQAAAGEQS